VRTFQILIVRAILQTASAFWGLCPIVPLPGLGPWTVLARSHGL